MITLGDNSVLVSYIQIRLRDSLYSKAPRTVGSVTTYDIPNGLRVTGSYDRDTYKCLSLFMNAVYKNEGFPYKSEYSVLGEDVDVQDIIDENIKLSYSHPEVLNIPDRVIAYMTYSVISNASPDEEIYWLKKFIYGSPSLIPKDILEESYGPKLTAVIKAEQGRISEKYKTIDIKVTGYFDPITEAYFNK